MNEQNMTQNEYLTIQQVQQLLNIGKAKAYSLTRMPDFPVCRMGRIARVPRGALMVWLARHTTGLDALSAAV